MKIKYICSECKDEIIRTIKEGDLIMLVKRECRECGNYIMFFEVIK